MLYQPITHPCFVLPFCSVSVCSQHANNELGYKEVRLSPVCRVGGNNNRIKHLATSDYRKNFQFGISAAQFLLLRYFWSTAGSGVEEIWKEIQIYIIIQTAEMVTAVSEKKQLEAWEQEASRHAHSCFWWGDLFGVKKFKVAELLCVMTATWLLLHTWWCKLSCRRIS